MTEAPRCGAVGVIASVKGLTARGVRGEGALGLLAGSFPAGSRGLDDTAGRIGGGFYSHFRRIQQGRVGRRALTAGGRPLAGAAT